MTKVFFRWLPCATLLAWSAMLLYFFFSGRIAGFLHPVFRPFVPAAGGVIFLLAAGSALAPAEIVCCDGKECAHPPGRMTLGRLLMFLVLLAPVCVAASLSTDRFGESAIRNRGVITDAAALKGSPAAGQAPAQTAAAGHAASDYLPKSSGGNLVVQVTDLLYAAAESSLRADFENKKIEIVGQLMPDAVNNPTGARFKLVRMLMVCCAADARPVAVRVEGGGKPGIPEMSWVKVSGEAAFPVEGGRVVAVIKADRIQVTDPPGEAMLY
jgi:uncharacterized repeat protein (TIGR03943 family)